MLHLVFLQCMLKCLLHLMWFIYQEAYNIFLNIDIYFFYCNNSWLTWTFNIRFLYSWNQVWSPYRYRLTFFWSYDSFILVINQMNTNEYLHVSYSIESENMIEKMIFTTLPGKGYTAVFEKDCPTEALSAWQYERFLRVMIGGSIKVHGVLARRKETSWIYALMLSPSILLKQGEFQSANSRGFNKVWSRQPVWVE